VRELKQCLRLAGCTYVVYNLEEDFTREEFIAEFGEGSTFPQVSCDGKKIGGSVETVKFLREQQKVA
jgi:glutaredoxin